MSTDKELEQKVTKLTEDVQQLQHSNSDMRDEIAILKNNYTTLVSEISTRLEVIHTRFQAS